MDNNKGTKSTQHNPTDDMDNSKGTKSIEV
jgi:hypothetical protein